MRKLPLIGNRENDDRHRREDEIVDHADHDIGELLAQQIFQPARRRDIEIDDRTQLLLAHDADRHQDRRNEDQQHGRDARNHRVDAFKRRIVHVAILKIGGVFLRRGLQFIRRIAQHLVLDVLHILRDGFAAKSVGAIRPPPGLRASDALRRSRPKFGGISRTSEMPSDCMRCSASSADRTGGISPEIARRSRRIVRDRPGSRASGRDRKLA